jgi:hypothetical protein
MKKILSFLILVLFLGTNTFALPIEITILPKEEIVKLSDQQLIDIYVDVLVELETAKTFYSRSGFQPKEIKIFKDLVRYRVLIIMEMYKRKIEFPKTE